MLKTWGLRKFARAGKMALKHDGSASRVLPRQKSLTGGLFHEANEALAVEHRVHAA